jgi:molybdopterin converting factor small subunit
MIINTVSVHFLGIHRQITGEDTIAVEISGTTSVGDLIGILNNRYPALELDEAASIITVNQVKAYPERLLKPDDAVSILPHISGG